MKRLIPLVLLMTMSLTGCGLLSLLTIRDRPAENNTPDTEHSGSERITVIADEEEYPCPVTFSYPGSWTAGTNQGVPFYSPDGKCAYMLQGVSILGHYTPEEFYNELRDMYAGSYEITYSDDMPADFTTADGIPAKIGRIEMTGNNVIFVVDVLIVPQKNVVVTFAAQCAGSVTMSADLRELTNTAEIQFGTEDFLTGNTFVSIDNSELCLHDDGTFLYYQNADDHSAPYCDGSYELFRGQDAVQKLIVMEELGLTEEELSQVMTANRDGYLIGGSLPTDLLGYSDRESYVVCDDDFYVLILHNGQLFKDGEVTTIGEDTPYLGYYIESLQMADLLNLNTITYAQFSLQDN